MTISASAWAEYVKKLGAMDAAATRKLGQYIGSYKGFSFNNPQHMKDLIDFAYALSVKYGEGAAELACEMYDEVGLASGLFLEPAVPADVAAYGEVAKAVNGTAKTRNENTIANAVGRLVKRAGADTMLKNAIRDGAQFAWVPHGDTCAFCIALASRGWQTVSSTTLKNGHAEHIHSNCDCTYAVRFDEKSGVKGYDPEKYLDMYESAEGDNPNDRINSIRRIKYQENRERINAQKRANYARKKMEQD